MVLRDGLVALRVHRILGAGTTVGLVGIEFNFASVQIVVIAIAVTHAARDGLVFTGNRIVGENIKLATVAVISVAVRKNGIVQTSQMIVFAGECFVCNEVVFAAVIVIGIAIGPTRITRQNTAVRFLIIFAGLGIIGIQLVLASGFKAPVAVGIPRFT